MKGPSLSVLLGTVVPIAGVWWKSSRGGEMIGRLTVRLVLSALVLGCASVAHAESLQHWTVYSRTAMATTGDVDLSSSRIVFQNRASLQLSYAGSTRDLTWLDSARATAASPSPKVTLENTDWELVELNGSPLTTRQAQNHLRFRLDAATKRMQGFAACEE